VGRDHSAALAATGCTGAAVNLTNALRVELGAWVEPPVQAPCLKQWRFLVGQRRGAMGSLLAALVSDRWLPRTGRPDTRCWRFVGKAGWITGGVAEDAESKAVLEHLVGRDHSAALAATGCTGAAVNLTNALRVELGGLGGATGASALS
jgi:hypothetical protein